MNGRSSLSDRSDVGATVARLARDDASRIAATLVRGLGSSAIELAEDAVQYALLQALRLWPGSGMPQVPAAWLFSVARNYVRGVWRRDRHAELADGLLDDLELPALKSSADERFSRELTDDELAFLFFACHPALSVESRVAFALRHVCGLNVRQIAAGMLANETAVAQRLVRARAALADLAVSIEPPSPDELPARLESVRAALFLLFNEGYSTSCGEALTAPDLCAEAVRLAVALAQHPTTAMPASDAFAACLMLNMARVPGRLSREGVALVLDEQHRELWDRQLLAAGLHALAHSARGNELTVWHLRAEIAAIHAIAPDAKETNWRRLLEIYDLLCAHDPSPIVALGRAVALSKVEGPRAGLSALADPLRQLPDNPYIQAAAGKFLLELEDAAAATAHFRRAMETARTEPERRRMLCYLQSATDRLARSSA